MLFSADNSGWTILHLTAKLGTTKAIDNILRALPRQITPRLSRKKDFEGKMARDWVEDSLKGDILDQVGSYPLNFYHLNTPPQVLIFYATKNRQSSEAEGGPAVSAEAEKDCVENFVIERGLPYSVRKDPTADDMFSEISKAQADESLSGLVVFVMCHGEKGLVSVEGRPDYLMVEELITQMCRGNGDTPKV